MIGGACSDGTVVAFLAKTWAMLNDPDNKDVICWDSEGKIIRILDVDALERYVLPSRFRHRKIKSFIRQLNMYGFKKVKRSFDSESFSHPCFTRDNKEALCLIQRRKKCREIRSQSEDNYEAQQQPVKLQSESNVFLRTAKKEELNPCIEPVGVPLLPQNYPQPQSVFYGIQAIPYLYEDFFSRGYMQPVAVDAFQHPFYGMLYR